MPLNDSVSHIVLLLTSTGDGQYVTFQVINAASQPISNVDVTAIRKNVVVEAGATDDAGAITFFLNPDFTYTFTFSKSGFITFTTTLKPTQSSYTVTLATTEEVSDNINQDIVHTIAPSGNILDNNTYYNFSFEIISGFFIIQSAGFTIVNSSDTSQLIGSASCSGDTGCSASANISTGNYENIQMDYYWEANNTFQNATKYWTVRKTSGFEGSFTLLKRDLGNLGAGFNDFTKMLVSFFIILMIVGAITWVSGQTSPLAILGEITASTWFLASINMIPKPPGAVDYFIPLVITVVFIGYALNEGRRLL